MGTRADFYIGRGLQAEWAGSVPTDGYQSALPDTLLFATTEALFRKYLDRLLSERRFPIYASDGWPWPWPDSSETFHVYAFDAGEVWISTFGSLWYRPDEKQPTEKLPEHSFPRMSEPRTWETCGPESGVGLVSTTEKFR